MWDNDRPDNHRLLQTVEVKEYESNSKQKVNIIIVEPQLLWSPLNKVTHYNVGTVCNPKLIPKTDLR